MDRVWRTGTHRASLQWSLGLLMCFVVACWLGTWSATRSLRRLFAVSDLVRLAKVGADDEYLSTYSGMLETSDCREPALRWEPYASEVDHGVPCRW